jgi:chromosomal replication initiator protein
MPFGNSVNSHPNIFMSSVWNNCLTKLESEIPSSEFNTWIRPLQAIEQEFKLTLLAPNRFVLDWVKERFFGKIEELVNDLTGGKMDPVLQIGSKQTPAPDYKKTVKRVDPKKTTPSFLNKSYTFDNFVEGKSNQLAKAASLQVSENVGRAYNPLLIYGSSGLGKTHLMHAIGNEILSRKPSLNIIYVHSEKFVQDMVKALQQNTINTFKDYYRNLDVLLIDDIQFFASKERSQEEFFHTFNTLLEKKHQVVLTSDKYPKEINNLTERLKSRFSSGLPVTIEPPDMETRAAILMKKAATANVDLDQDVALFIAKRIPSNVRDLEGALRRVIANAQFTGKDIDIDFTKEALHDLISMRDKLVDINNIQKTVAEYFKIRIADLSAKSRRQSVTRPRQIAMSLARELTSLSYPDIGDAFGGRDHTTVINACNRINTLKESDIKVAEDYFNLLRTLSH